jgi:hypothetical protein
LGVGEDASESAVILAYKQIEESGDEKAASAYRVLRSYFRSAGPDPAGASGTAPPESPAGDRPPERYYRVLGLKSGVSWERVSNAHERLSEAIVDDEDEDRIRRSIDLARSVLDAYFKRVRLEEKTWGAIDGDKGPGFQDEDQADATEKTDFAGPPSILKAYELLQVPPGAPMEEVESKCFLLLESETDEELLKSYSRSFQLISRWWDKQISEVVFVSQKRLGRRGLERQQEPELNPLIVHYQKVLDVPPGASLSEIETAYQARQAELQSLPPESADKQLHEAERAFRILARVNTEQEQVEKTERRKQHALRTILIAGAITIGMALAIFQFNKLFFRAQFVSFEIGDEIFSRRDRSHFGTVIDFDADYQFRVGAPVPAYRIHLADSDSEIWMSKKQAVKALRTGEFE